MPIKGLTDSTSSVGAAMPRVATLHKGEPQRTIERNGRQVNTVGRDLDHFRVEFEPQFEYLRETWVALYGEKPDSFQPVYLTAGTVDEAFPSWKEEWNATTLLHRCDGEEQHRWYNQSIGRYSDARMPCAAPSCKCKFVARLNLILPDFVEQSGVLGVVTLSTTSINDILTLTRYLQGVVQMVGTLSGVPFVFGRAAQELSAPKPNAANGERIKTTKSMCYLHVAPDFTRQFVLPALAARPVAPALPASVDTSTGEIIDGRRLLGNGDERRIGASESKNDTSTDDKVEMWWIDEDNSVFRDDEPIADHFAVIRGPFDSEAEARAALAQSAHWSDDAEAVAAFWTWLTSYYVISSPQMLFSFLDIDGWGDLPEDRKEAAQEINSAIWESGGSEASFPMVARAAEYHKAQQGAYLLLRAAWNLRMYGSREVLAAQLGTPSIAGMEDNAQVTLDAPVSVSWEVRGKNGSRYGLVVDMPTIIQTAPETV